MTTTTRTGTRTGADPPPVQPFEAIPGPGGRPVVGVLGDIRRDMLGFLERTAAAGHPLDRFSVAVIRCVLVNDPDLVLRVFTSLDAKLRKPWDERQLSMILGNGLLVNEGESWRRQRRLIQPAFTKERLLGYAPAMVRAADHVLDRWQDGQVREVHADMAALTLAIVTETLLGASPGRGEEVVTRALELSLRQFERMITGLVPLPLWAPTPGNLAARRAVRALDRFVFGLIAERRRGAAATGGDDLLGRLVEAGDGAGVMSDRQIRDELVTFLMAGHETTALALTWALWLGARHPAEAERLREEVDGVLGGRAPGAGDLERLTYTRAFLDEAMRLYPPAWGIGRETVEPIELGGYRIPKGTQLFLVPWTVHRDARWWDEPTAFRPERFLAGALSPVSRRAYFPFGLGPRACIGSHFALLEGTLVLARIAQRFDLEVEADHPIELEPAVTLRPRHGIRLRLRLRRRPGADGALRPAPAAALG